MLPPHPSSDTDSEALRVREMAQAAWLIDLGRCQIVSASPAGLERLGLSPAEPFPVVFDRATPAVATLASACGLAETNREKAIRLVFWTRAGAPTVEAWPVVISGQGATALVRVLAAEPEAPPAESRRSLLMAPSTRMIADQPPLADIDDEPAFDPVTADPIEVAPGNTEPPVATTEPDDLDPPPRRRTDSETLAEIARRIRLGTSGSAEPPQPAALKPATEPVAIITPEQTDTPAQRTWSDLEIAKLAHELRTPIAAIAALAEIMRDERLGTMGNSRYRGYAADVHDSAQHALALLTELGNDAGGLDTEQPRTPQIIDANAIISSCVSLMRPLADRAGVQLTTSLAARLPAIEADARSLKQILLNLLSNAVRHTPHAGEVTVTSAHRLGGAVRVEVRDTGAGMAEHEIANALDPNFKQPPNTRSPSGSTGFGLPLVRALAAANGAELQIDSRPGAGTRVALTFRAERAVPPTS